MPWVHRTVRLRRTAVRTLTGALAAALLLGTLGAAGAQAAAVADPVAPAAPPAAVEGFAPYLPQVSCDPTVKPGLDALRSTLLATYGGRDLGVTRGCDIGSTSEHKEGRAWDWGLSAAVPAEKALAEQFLTWLLAPGPNGMAAYNARRLGVMYVIWDGRIWSSYRAAEGWRAYSGGESHADHIHISLAWTGAMKRTLVVDRQGGRGRLRPLPRGRGHAGAGLQRSAQHAVPRARRPVVPHRHAVAEAGRHQPVRHPAPAAAGRDAGDRLLRPDHQHRAADVPEGARAGRHGYDDARDLGRGPQPGGRTAHRHRRRSPVAPRPSPPRGHCPSAMHYSVRKGDSLSRIAAVWRSSVAAIKSASKLTSDTIRVGQVITVPVRSGITKFTWTTLRKGDKGVAVKALQTALRMKAKYRTGVFGDITKGRVNALKAARGWPADGVAGPGVWRALGA